MKKGRFTEEQIAYALHQAETGTSNNRRARVLADHLPVVIGALTSRRVGPGPHWVMVVEVAGFLGRHKTTVTRYELELAIDRAVSVKRIKAQGDPPHSLALFQPPGQWIGG